MCTTAKWLLIAFVLPMGCTAPLVLDKTLIPAMQSSWPGVVEYIDSEDHDVIGSTFAIESGDPWAISSIPWPTIEAKALESIAALEFSEGVKRALRERVTQFAIAWRQVVEAMQ